MYDPQSTSPGSITTKYLDAFVKTKVMVTLGVPFCPQDFHLMVISMITRIVFVIHFTVIYGRIFCG
jgi:polyferredoxin